MNLETIMLGLVTVLVTTIGYLLSRFFYKTETWGQILNNLDKMVSVISVRLENLTHDTSNNTKDINHLRKIVLKLEKQVTALRNSLEFCQTKNPSCTYHNDNKP